jgi:hypothetical protein
MAARFNIQPSEFDRMTSGDFFEWLRRLEWFHEAEARAVAKAQKARGRGR